MNHIDWRSLRDSQSIRNIHYVLHWKSSTEDIWSCSDIFCNWSCSNEYQTFVTRRNLYTNWTFGQVGTAHLEVKLLRRFAINLNGNIALKSRCVTNPVPLLISLIECIKQVKHSAKKPPHFNFCLTPLLLISNNMKDSKMSN